LLTDQDNDKNGDNNKVTLMTIHAAKGLEFRHIYIVGMEEGLFPSNRSAGNSRELEEERRLFYVALTRAEEKATISYALSRYKWGNPESCSPSRFIKEIDATFLDIDADDSFKTFTTNERLRTRSDTTAGFKKKTRPVAEILVKPNPKLVKVKSSNNAGIMTNPEYESIVAGVNVEHERFGVGKVLNVEGLAPNTKATVFFKSAGQKQLLLKFAKLKVLS